MIIWKNQTQKEMNTQTARTKETIIESIRNLDLHHHFSSSDLKDSQGDNGDLILYRYNLPLLKPLSEQL